MKSRDLRRLISAEKTKSAEIRRDLTNLRLERERTDAKRDAMNAQFRNMRPDPEGARYVRFVAFENRRLTREGVRLDKRIDEVADRVREAVREEKMLEIMSERLNKERKLRRARAEEQANDDFMIFKYMKQRAEDSDL